MIKAFRRTIDDVTRRQERLIRIDLMKKKFRKFLLEVYDRSLLDFLSNYYVFIYFYVHMCIKIADLKTGLSWREKD
jgi:hypothetical protein